MIPSEEPIGRQSKRLRGPTNADFVLASRTIVPSDPTEILSSDERQHVQPSDSISLGKAE